ncbi:ATP-binding protein [Yinghuangia sp. YIM S10712]|uniref:ATP-binding protein n=1 Tax=Yinghuangia sp. YIM S10712 TaxID=3436930 RepID=UPI003F52FBF8
MTTHRHPVDASAAPFVPMRYPHEATWSLPHHPRSAGEARAQLREHAYIWRLGDEVATTAQLLLSELVTNACRHARPLPGDRVTVRCALSPTRTLRVEVTDGDPLELPYPRRASPTDISGRGLALVATLADAWGVRALPGTTGKTVWFELTAPPPEHESPAARPRPAETDEGHR